MIAKRFFWQNDPSHNREPMTVARMVWLINSSHFKPGWEISAEDYTRRYEQCVRVAVEFDAPNSNRELGFVGYPQMIRPLNHFILRLCDCADEFQLYGRVLDIIATVDSHEAREFFQIGPDRDPVFHPHTLSGITAWSEYRNDPSTILADESFGK